MRMDEQLCPRGEVRLWFYRGGIPLPEVSPNRITRLGRERFHRLFSSDPEALPPSQIAIGSGASPASPEDKTLETPGLHLPFSAPPAYAGPSVTFQASLREDQAIGALGYANLACSMPRERCLPASCARKIRSKPAIWVCCFSGKSNSNGGEINANPRFTMA